MMDVPVTLSVPDFGRAALDVGSNTSYEAAERGDIPVIKVGPKLKRVPVRQALLKLAGGDHAMLEKLTADFLQRLQKIEQQKDRRGRLRGTKVIDGEVVAPA
jgi:hypothetical protein